MPDTREIVTPAFKSLQAVGSMASGSTTLTLVSNPGFLVNDKIIVEIGGESGGGLRNTMGVGGQWPVRADHDSNMYYNQVPVPKTLVAQITAMSGVGNTILTLNTASSTATTNANVYYDNHPVWLTLGLASSSSPTAYDNKVITFPAGRFAFSNSLRVNNGTGIGVRGAGRDLTELYRPRGGETIFFDFVQCDACTLQKLHMNIQYNLQGYNIPQGTGEFFWTAGAIFSLSRNCIAADLKFTQCAAWAVSTRKALRMFTDNILIIRTDPLAAYAQWQIHVADELTNQGRLAPATAAEGTSNITRDCLVEGDWLIKAFNSFSCRGDQWIRCGGQNAVFAMNSSGHFWLEECFSNVESMSRYTGGPEISLNEGIINMSTNIGREPEGLGGTIKNCRVIQSGAVDAGGHSMISISANAAYPSVRLRIIGTDYNKALIDRPTLPGATLNYDILCDMADPQVVIDGYRCAQPAYPGWNNIQVHAGGAPVRNCIVERIRKVDPATGFTTSFFEPPYTNGNRANPTP